MNLLKTKKRRAQKFIKYFGQYIINISQTVFSVSVITFIIYLVLEDFKTGLISNYFDLNFLLFLATISGLMVILFNEKASFKTKNHYHFFSLIFALLVAVFSYSYLKSLEEIGLFISLIAGIAIFIIIELFND